MDNLVWRRKKSVIICFKRFLNKSIPYWKYCNTNIYSKNIIDIIIETNDNNSFDNIISILSKEWELRWKEDNRAFLVKGYGPNGFLTKVFHLHIRKKGDIDEVKFKEILLKNPEVARTYEKLKLKLEIKYKYDRESYTNGKTELINKIKKDYGLHK